MFKIFDGRSHFYQWDLDRKIIVEDSSIEQVHFCNRTDDCSLVCEVYDEDGKRVVNVPNVLLQDIWRINVYGYDVNYTKYSAYFDIFPRTKPESYIYTETETLNFNTLLERMNEVDESIEAVVTEYLEANPPEVDLGGYATIDYVDAAIEAIDFPEPDMSGYATVDYVDNVVENIKIPEVDLTGYATETYVKSYAQPKGNYALKSEIPDVSGFITKIPAEYVTETELNAKGYLTEHQSLEGYAKTTDIPDVSGFQTEAQVIALINANMPVSGDEVSY